VFEFISAIFKIFPKVKWAAIIGLGFLIFGDDLGRGLGLALLSCVIVFVIGSWILNEEMESDKKNRERRDRKR